MAAERGSRDFCACATRCKLLQTKLDTARQQSAHADAASSAAQGGQAGGSGTPRASPRAADGANFDGLYQTRLKITALTQFSVDKHQAMDWKLLESVD